MSNEAQLQVSLRISKGSKIFQSQPTGFTADVNGNGGPTPGAFTATLAGTDADLSKLTTPGLAWMQNTDPVNYVEYGPYDPDTSEFLPIGELLPGECFPIRLSRFLGKEYGNVAGTGTIGSGITLRFKAIGAPCIVILHAFDQ